MLRGRNIYGKKGRQIEKVGEEQTKREAFRREECWDQNGKGPIEFAAFGLVLCKLTWRQIVEL